MGRICVAEQDFKTVEGKTIQKGTAFTVEDESSDPIEISVDAHFVFHVARDTFLSSTRLKSDQ